MPWKSFVSLTKESSKITFNIAHFLTISACNTLNSRQRSKHSIWLPVDRYLKADRFNRTKNIASIGLLQPAKMKKFPFFIWTYIYYRIVYYPYFKKSVNSFFFFGTNQILYWEYNSFCFISISNFIANSGAKTYIPKASNIRRYIKWIWKQ